MRCAFISVRNSAIDCGRSARLLAIVFLIKFEKSVVTLRFIASIAGAPFADAYSISRWSKNL